MGIYTEKDIVTGKTITANGMLAGYVNVPGKDKPQFRFISKSNNQSLEKNKQNGKKNNQNLKIKNKQNGGGEKRPVSLKTAVKLLRQYYQEKYA